jgi:HK97 family phage major capsid protein
MNKSKEFKALEVSLATAVSEAQALKKKDGVTADEINAKTEDIKTIKAKIEMQKVEDEGKEFDEGGIEVKDMKPVNSPVYAEPANHKNGPFNSFGEQMLAIVRSSKRGSPIDERLLKIQNSTGSNEAVPSEGGFLVQEDFATELLKDVYEIGVLAPRCRRMKISSGANGMKINGIDESSRETGYRWGGVQGYWVEEGGTVTPSKPKFRQIKLELKKLMAIYYSTEELMMDASAMDGVLRQAFTEEMQFLLDDAVFRGDGSGKPLGVLNSGGLVTQAKETGQAADTVIYENIVNMWSRLLPKARRNAEWYINQEIEPQLYSMVMPVGTSGVPVYMPAGGISGQQYGTLFGRPVVPLEHSSKAGDVGDILLGDFNQYLLADKNGIQMASSIHVLFLYDELAFRITYRVDGQPIRQTAVTPYKGASDRTLGDFIALQAR